MSTTNNSNPSTSRALVVALSTLALTAGGAAAFYLWKKKKAAPIASQSLEAAADSAPSTAATSAAPAESTENTETSVTAVSKPAKSKAAAAPSAPAPEPVPIVKPGQEVYEEISSLIAKAFQSLQESDISAFNPSSATFKRVDELCLDHLPFATCLEIIQYFLLAHDTTRDPPGLLPIQPLTPKDKEIKAALEKVWAISKTCDPPASLDERRGLARFKLELAWRLSNVEYMTDALAVVLAFKNNLDPQEMSVVFFVTLLLGDLATAVEISQKLKFDAERIRQLHLQAQPMDMNSPDMGRFDFSALLNYAKEFTRRNAPAFPLIEPASVTYNVTRFRVRLKHIPTEQGRRLIGKAFIDVPAKKLSQIHRVGSAVRWLACTHDSVSIPVSGYMTEDKIKMTGHISYVEREGGPEASLSETFEITRRSVLNNVETWAGISTMRRIGGKLPNETVICEVEIDMAPIKAGGSKRHKRRK